MVLNNGNTGLKGTVSMTPIGSKITLESAKTNRLQPCLLHSSLCTAHTHCHLRLPSVLTDLLEEEIDKKGAVLLIFYYDKVSTLSPLSFLFSLSLGVWGNLWSSVIIMLIFVFYFFLHLSLLFLIFKRSHQKLRTDKIL